MLYEIEELMEYAQANPDSLDRVFDEDDQVDWGFLNRTACIPTAANPIERELAALERYCGKTAVLHKLAEMGIIETTEDPDMLAVAEAYRARLEERRRNHSRWGNGHKTTSAPR